MAANESERDNVVPCKKQKLEDLSEETVHNDLKDLSDFRLKEVLHNNTSRKTVCLRGSFESREGDALVILEKTAFSGDNLTPKSEYFTEKSSLEKVFHNDAYGNYNYFPIQRLNSIKTTIIHPATEKHIVKFSSHNSYIVDETPDIYSRVVLPHITRDKFDLQWVYNILEHKSESDRILVEDPDPLNGFVVVPDLKWNGEIDTLYFLAICNRRDLKSLRDLTGSHLPLLKNIKQKTLEAIESKYGLDSSQLRTYFHYQPSFYHLHIHFTYLKHEAPGILAERAHMLTSVISNIELLPDYYQKKSRASSRSKMYKSIVIEQRPKLQSANVFIVLEVACPAGATVNLSPNEVQIVFNDQKLFKVPFGDFSAEPSTLSSLKITPQFISFRFLAAPKGAPNFGSFKAELLKSDLESTQIKGPKGVKERASYVIDCANCHRNLAARKLQFQRVLPLPENPDSGDWFCHGGTPGFTLEPSLTDLFYSGCFVHVSQGNICNILSKSDVVACKFCLNWLGIVPGNNAFKLWFNTVRFTDDRTVIHTKALSDAFLVIRSLFDNCLFNSLKFVLQCKHPSNKRNSLLIWVLEKHLKVIIYDNQGKRSDVEVAKALFKFFEDDSAETVKQWQRDHNVETIDVSKAMMVEILKHLHENNRLFPADFAKSNDLLVSYLFLYE